MITAPPRFHPHALALALLTAAMAPGGVEAAPLDPVDLGATYGVFAAFVADGDVNINTAESPPTFEDKTHSLRGFELNGVAVFVFEGMTIPSGVTITVTGDRPLALLSTGSLTLDGVLQLAGVGNTPGPGGFAGATSTRRSGEGPGGGDSSDPFGGGGGFGGRGDGNVSGGLPYGDLREELQGGSGGGAGGGGLSVALGGGGGGAVELGAAGALHMGGYIDVNGGAGASDGFATGGGGAGGGVLLRGDTSSVCDGRITADGGLSAQAGGGGEGGGGRITLINVYNCSVVQAAPNGVTEFLTDADLDGFMSDADCNDNAATVYPGAPTVVGDDVDDDCDGHVECFEDADGDGYGSAQEVPGDLACDDPLAGVASQAGDCADNDADIQPGANEVPCNAIDDDCDPSTPDCPDTGSTGHTGGTDTGTDTAVEVAPSARAAPAAPLGHPLCACDASMAPTLDLWRVLARR